MCFFMEGFREILVNSPKYRALGFDFLLFWAWLGLDFGFGLVNFTQKKYKEAV